MSMRERKIEDLLSQLDGIVFDHLSNEEFWVNERRIDAMRQRLLRVQREVREAKAIARKVLRARA